jgi:DNA primase
LKDILDIQSLPISEIAARLGIIIKHKHAMCFRGHDRNTPSLSFNFTKNLWHCFGCGIGGSNFQLVQHYYEFDFKTTLQWFRQEFSLSTPIINRFPKPKPLKTTDAPVEVDEEIYKAFYQMLSLSVNGLKYCRQRGFTVETIMRSGIRDIEDTEQTFIQLKKQFDLRRIVKCGLAQDIGGTVKFAWWHPVLVIPFWDTEGRLCYFQGRHKSVAHNPKYVNLSGLSKAVYNVNCLRELAKGSEIFIMEGVMDP